MNYYIFSLGLIILAFTATDLFNTSLSVRGAGYMTKRLSKNIWTILLMIHRKTGAKKPLELGGAIILVSILLNWLFLIWTGASLMFISQFDSLMNVETNTTTSISDKIFYTGYTLSTLGLGDIEPSSSFWDILTAILSFVGLILISIAITYFIPVVSAEIIKRKVSMYITTLGSSAETILINYWNGQNFKELELPFISLTESIILHAQNHKAYSVLHFFHSSDQKEAFSLNLTNLDEALSILILGIPTDKQPSINVVMGLRKAITSYLITLPEAFITPGKETPPLPEFTELKNMGIPLINREAIEQGYGDIMSRRRLLLSLIKDDGWNWTDLQAVKYNHETIFLSSKVNVQI
jgi:hypothetical protein